MKTSQSDLNGFGGLEFLEACRARWRTRFDVTACDWIEAHGSGTLRKNKRLGMSWKSQYLEERVSFEFGYEFEALSGNRVTQGIPLTCGDCKASTETGWFTDRMQTIDIFGDRPSPSYISVEYPDGTRREGLGIVLNLTHRPAWLPESYKVFAIVGEYDPDHKDYVSSLNPC